MQVRTFLTLQHKTIKQDSIYSRKSNDIMSAQPFPYQAYEVAGNPTDKSELEQSRAQLNAKTDDENAV